MDTGPLYIHNYLFVFVCLYCSVCFVESIACSGYKHNVHGMLMGYIMGYLAILTGHRAVVFINMTKENVINCERWKKDSRYNILVCIF